MHLPLSCCLAYTQGSVNSSCQRKQSKRNRIVFPNTLTGKRLQLLRNSPKEPELKLLCETALSQYAPSISLLIRQTVSPIALHRISKSWFTNAVLYTATVFHFC